jgi:hypothetical protein
MAEHRAAWLTAAAVLVAAGLAGVLGLPIASAEYPRTHFPIWPIYLAAGALIAGVFLFAAIIKGWPLPGGPSRHTSAPIETEDQPGPTVDISAGTLKQGASGRIIGARVRVQSSGDIENDGLIGNADSIDSPAVLVLAHRAVFESDPTVWHVFVKVTNVADRDVEVTHMWFATTPVVHVVRLGEQLFPVRLAPGQSHEWWWPIDSFVNATGIEGLARVRLSDQTVVVSHLHQDVPPLGYVAAIGTIETPAVTGVSPAELEKWRRELPPPVTGAVARPAPTTGPVPRRRKDRKERRP